MKHLASALVLMVCGLVHAAPYLKRADMGRMEVSLKK